MELMPWPEEKLGSPLYPSKHSHIDQAGGTGFAKAAKPGGGSQM